MSARRTTLPDKSDDVMAGGALVAPVMQIGEVAARTGLSLKSIRYYEDVGLLASRRSAGGFRLYDDEAVRRVLLIMHMKPLDFSLADMKELLDAVDPFPGAAPVPLDPAERRLLVQRYLDEVERRTAALRRRLARAEEFRGQLGRHLTGLS